EVHALFPFKSEETEEEASESTQLDLPEKYQDYQLSSDGTIGVVLVSVNVSSTDVDGASALYDQGVALVDFLDPASYHPEMKAEVVGAFRDFLEVRTLMNDAN